jgi:hypothetical protein
MKQLIFVMMVLPMQLFSQIDTAFLMQLKAYDTANVLKADTMRVPEDGLTKKIRFLLKGKSGFGLSQIIAIKIMEEKEKDKIRPKEFYERLHREVSIGHTARLIENMMINMYRRNFTETEVEEMIAFYKTSAGKKLDKINMLLVVESVKGAEQLLNIITQQLH